MFCNKCGNEIKTNQQYCEKCGNKLPQNINKGINKNTISKKKNRIINKMLILVIILLFIFITIVLLVLSNNNNNYYFSEDNKKTEQNIDTNKSSSTNTETKKYKTDIVTDNSYSRLYINNLEDAKNIIRKDSLEQKTLDYSDEIIEIENDIIEKYSITAVNLKEMDLEFAQELEGVLNNIYENYPSAREHLTNLTLTNLGILEGNSVIALFMPSFIFGTSDTTTTRPWVIKTQIQLNAKFFLNEERLESTVETSSKVGHFPQNATSYSPLAHEFGHYLSFIALLNYYNIDTITLIEDNNLQNYYNIIKVFSDGSFSKKMIDEAYNNYINNGGTISNLDEWRGTISKYALAKDESGQYIYDETVAEAFHDVYLNNNNANIASKYIVEVLKKYIEG